MPSIFTLKILNHTPNSLGLSNVKGEDPKGETMELKASDVNTWMNTKLHESFGDWVGISLVTDHSDAPLNDANFQCNYFNNCQKIYEQEKTIWGTNNRINYPKKHLTKHY